MNEKVKELINSINRYQEIVYFYFALLYNTDYYLVSFKKEDKNIIYNNATDLDICIELNGEYIYYSNFYGFYSINIEMYNILDSLYSFPFIKLIEDKDIKRQIKNGIK